MNLSMTADYTTTRAFNDEVAYNPARDTFSSVLQRAAVAYGGGVAVVALLAAILH